MMCPRLLPLHVRERRRDAVQHALDVYIYHPVPLVHLEPLERRQRHEPGVVEHHIHPPVASRPPHPPAACTCSYRVTSVSTASAFPPRPARSLARASIRSARRAPSTTARTLRREMPRRRLPQPAARARDDDDLPCNVVAHDPEGSCPRFHIVPPPPTYRLIALSPFALKAPICPHPRRQKCVPPFVPLGVPRHEDRQPSTPRPAINLTPFVAAVCCAS